MIIQDICYSGIEKFLLNCIGIHTIVNLYLYRLFAVDYFFSILTICHAFPSLLLPFYLICPSLSTRCLREKQTANILDVHFLRQYQSMCWCVSMCDMTIYLAGRHLTVLITRIGAATYWKKHDQCGLLQIFEFDCSLAIVHVNMPLCLLGQTNVSVMVLFPVVHIQMLSQ